MALTRNHLFCLYAGVWQLVMIVLYAVFMRYQQPEVVRKKHGGGRLESYDYLQVACFLIVTSEDRK